MDGDKILKGIVRFAMKLVPGGPFYHITNNSLNVKVGSPIIEFNESDEYIKSKSFVPIIFSHGVGCTTTWFSCICKDLAS